MLFLSKVEHTFTIAGRGCVIVPVAPRPDCDFRLRARSPIQLRMSDGRVINTYIASLEVLGGPEVKGRMAFLLPDEITKHDVPKGAEIWLFQD